MPTSTKIQSKTQRVGLLKQPKTSNHWAAANDETGAYETQCYDKGVTLPDLDVTIDEYECMNGHSGVVSEYDNFHIDANSGLPKLNFSGHATKETIAKHMLSVFQSVTEGASTPFDKTFVPADSVVNWRANEGHLFTVAYDTGISGKGYILENALLNEYSLVIDTLARGNKRYAMQSGSWIGNKLTPDITFSGTWTTPARTVYNTAAASFENMLNYTLGEISTLSQSFLRFEFKYSAGIRTDFATYGGMASNYLWAPKYQFIVDLPYCEDTAHLAGAYKAGSLAKIIVLGNNIAGGTDGSLIFANTYGHLAEKPEKYDGDYVGLRMVINIERPTANGAWATIVRLSDAIDGGY